MTYHSKQDNQPQENLEINSKKEKRTPIRFSFLKFVYFPFVLLFSFFVVITFLVGERIWLFSLLSFLPPIIFLILSLLILCVTLVVFFRNTASKLNVILLVLTTVTLLFGILLSDININLSGSGEEQTEQVKIFNWNTEFWEKFSNANTFIDFLKTQDADIYTLQEFIPLPNENALSEEEIKNYVAEIENAFPNYKVIKEGEFLTLSKFELFNVSRDVENKFFRVDVWINDEIVSVYNVHVPVQADLNFYGDTIGFIKNVRSRFEWRKDVIQALENDIRGNKRPLIIAGDFNTTSTMGSIKSLKRLTNDSVSASSYLYNPTWNSTGLRLWRIDYVLGNNKINFISHKTVDSSQMSDHKGLLVEFNLKD